jgi:DNA polymerase-4
LSSSGRDSLRAKSRLGRTVTVRVRFANLRSVTRSLTLPAPISATAILAEIAEDLVRGVLAKHPDEKTISLVAISVSNLEKQSVLQLELPLGLADEDRRPGFKKGASRWLADRAVDMIRERFGWEAIGYASAALGLSHSIPDEFRELAEKRAVTIIACWLLLIRRDWHSLPASSALPFRQQLRT